ncbi:MAG: RNA polymerase subunit sigma-24 [Anaerolineaceae bacterium]|nr:RNA polymerase subunit sigma-24 [Anaerolineaceae bacterium]
MSEEQNFDEPLNIEALKTGDRHELAKMVELYSDQVYRVALKMLNNPSDAEDVLQETFIKAMRAIKNFQERSTISTWLYRIAVNESLMFLRKQKPEAVVIEEEPQNNEDQDYSAIQVVDWCCLPEKEFLSSESRAHLNEAIQNLPAKFRSVFILRDIEGLSIRETAEALNLTETNVKTRLLRARMRLREDLTQYYGERMAEVKNE